ncbi:LLM class flavin-dependent oxidoreductase [Mycobacterium sp.]|uniref:LLM class flavin-dependent oxidoreductase n=1 Tax=Mycobacterium sp. TaxID=1785 RepID=UPI002D996563|nr:LLM class flavin-dependent oxidoreductase [Mycobacterium sp.]
MEFMISFFNTLPNHMRGNPDAEHKVIMTDLEYMIAAEEAGFKYVIVPEHHFLDEYSHISGNAPVLGYLAHATKRIHLLSGIMNPLPQIRHPATVAEACAYLDHISCGRFEFGSGRGAGSHEILAFFPEGTEINHTKEVWEDVISEIPKMWMQETYEGYSSKYWSLPPRKIVPKPYGKGHPPLWYAAGNTPSWENAGRKGMGLIGNSITNLATAEKANEAYRKGIANAEPIGAFVNDYLSAVFHPFVSEDEGKAFDWVMSEEVAHQRSLLYRYHDTFPRPLGIPLWPELAPPTTRQEVLAMQQAGSLIGTPDQVIETLRKYAELGVNGVGFGVGMFGREHALETIEVFGKYIIPALDTDPEFRTDGFRYGTTP